MNANELAIGDKAAWTMLDGNTMAGEVIDKGYSYAMVRRVDGGTCVVAYPKLRRATFDDINSACKFFAKIGG